MTYLEGGKPIPVNWKMLDKDYCSSIAGNYTLEYGLTKERIEQEIHAHAVLYLMGLTMEICEAISNIPFSSSVSSYLIEHGKEISLGDDAWYEVAVFKAIWNMGN